MVAMVFVDSAVVVHCNLPGECKSSMFSKLRVEIQRPVACSSLPFVSTFWPAGWVWGQPASDNQDQTGLLLYGLLQACFIVQSVLYTIQLVL